jgi:TATA-box binding protein (TBP) (component of TFIID and TFIIIB)
MNAIATTRSYVVKSNIKFNFSQLLNNISSVVSTNTDDGSIVQILSGFNNAVTFTMRCDGRRISINLFCNGTIQIAGPQTLDTTIKCLGFIDRVLQNVSDFPIQKCSFTISSVMCNFNFELGFAVDEQQLVTFVNEKTQSEHFIAFLHHKNTVICAYPIFFDEETVTVWDGHTLSENVVPIHSKKKFVTFFVFSTGKVVVTGKNDSVIPPIKIKFQNLIDQLIRERPSARSDVQEKLSKKHTYKEIKIFKFADKQYVVAKGTKTYINHRTKELQKRYPSLSEVFRCNQDTENVIDAINKLKISKEITKSKISISLGTNLTEQTFLEKITLQQ